LFGIIGIIKMDLKEMWKYDCTLKGRGGRPATTR
jgi:hypothetical protein